MLMCSKPCGAGTLLTYMGAYGIFWKERASGSYQTAILGGSHDHSIA
jgi:hypothetical protein